MDKNYFKRFKHRLFLGLHFRRLLFFTSTIVSIFKVQADSAFSSKSSVIDINEMVSVVNRIDTFQTMTSILIQNFKIEGTIIDVNGMPLPGATILEEGTSNGVQSDFDGKFVITVKSKDAHLRVSYIGYLTQDIEINGQTKISITMYEDVAKLDEVVVIGYGERTKKSIAGSIEQISGEILENRPITNVLNGLQGALPGLTVTRSSGTPGSEGYDLNVRGLNSLNGGNSPLVLIDGVEGNLNLLNPNDIQSTTLLKDASASIYGARAAGGVLLITTKTGKKEQKINFTYSTNYSTNVISNLTQRVNIRQWIEMDWEAKLASGSIPQFAGGGTLEEVLAKVDAGAEPDYIGGNAYLFYEDVDWDDILFDDGVQVNHNFSVNGGGDRTDYATSFGYTKVDGILSDGWDSDERYNLRLNHGYDITDKLRLESRISYNRSRTLEGPRGSSNVFALRNKMFTWFPVYTLSGSTYGEQWGFENPKQWASNDPGKSTRIRENINGNFNLSYKIFKDLKLQGQVAINRNIGNDEHFRNIVPRINYNDTPAGFAQNRTELLLWNQNSTYKNLSLYLDYRIKFSKKHDINVMAGISHEENESKSFWASRDEFSQTEVLSLNLGSNENMLNSSNANHWAIRSYFGRLTYVFDTKYVAELNYRRDGTSVFSPAKRWGDFGGVSLNWIASEEKFIKKLNVFNLLKVRASYGTTGNQNLNVGNLYDYISLINIGGVYPFGDGERAQSASEAGLVSQSRTWEDLETTNLGLDFAILNSRLSGSLDIYKKNNNNMLLGVNLPSVLGGAPPAKNIGSLETKGFEFSLNWNDQLSSNFSYGIGFYLSDNNNILTDLDGRDLISGTREGYPLGTIWGYVWDGIIQNQVELNEYKKLTGIPNNIEIGDARYKDVNGDGKISLYDDEGNDGDVINLGTNAPRYSFGVNLSAKYKSFDFSAFIQGVGKRTVFYQGAFAIPFEQPWWQPLKRFYGNTWQPDNPTAKYPRLTTGSTRYWNYLTSENTRVNGAYARLKNITFGYSLPKDVLNKLRLSNLRIYFSGEDLFTLDHMTGGYDAENTNGSDVFYPFTKRYSIGLNLTF